MQNSQAMDCERRGVLTREHGWFTTVMPVQRSITSQSDVFVSSFTTREVCALLQRPSGAGAFISKPFSFPGTEGRWHRTGGLFASLLQPVAFVRAQHAAPILDVLRGAVLSLVHRPGLFLWTGLMVG
jgi:hypothetical protein